MNDEMNECPKQFYSGISTQQTGKKKLIKIFKSTEKYFVIESRQGTSSSNSVIRKMFWPINYYLGPSLLYNNKI
jgi:hypothetical protein